MEALNQLTLNKPKQLLRAIFFTTLAEIVSFLWIFFAVAFLVILLTPYVDSTKELNLQALAWISLASLAYLVVMYFFEGFAYVHNFSACYENSREGRIILIEHIRKLPLGKIEQRDPAALSFTIMQEFENLEHAISGFVPQMVGGLILSTLVFIGFLFVDIPMAFGFFCCIPVALLFLYGAKKVSAVLSLKLMAAKVEANNRMQEYIGGIKIIKAYSLAGEKFEKIQQSFDTLRKSAINIEVLIMPFAIASILCMGSGIGIMIVIARGGLVSGSMDIITFVALLLVAGKALTPLINTAINFIEMTYYFKSALKIQSLLDEPIMQGDETAPYQNSIVLKNVSFSYQTQPTLKGINLTLKPNTLTAIVGHSGSGKSTLAKLIARFYDPNTGIVQLGDRDLKEINPESLYKNFSFVFQENYLFSDTIYNNIAFGKKGATREEVLKASALARCDAFIQELPKKYETFVSEGGSSLSGGQKQRIAIARALLKDSPLIILDEMTSSLDVYNQYQLQQAISALVKHKTLLIIAHRLESIIHADNIVVLEQGEIKEQGTHKSLLEKKGLYYKMWEITKN